MLPFDTFATIIQHTPLNSIDLIVRDEVGRVLLGLRNNQPARDHWFVPGGRIYKDERSADAFRRITEHELGRVVSLSDAAFLGVFEHLYETSLVDPAVTTHYLVLGFALQIRANEIAHLPGQQHGQWRWWAVDDLLAAENVHPNTKAYFDSTAAPTRIV